MKLLSLLYTTAFTDLHTHVRRHTFEMLPVVLFKSYHFLQDPELVTEVFLTRIKIVECNTLNLLGLMTKCEGRYDSENY